MSWYSQHHYRYALRKHMLRVDLRVYPGDLTQSNQNDTQSVLKSILTSAIIKGLDVVGIVSNTGPETGWQAHNIAKESHLDIFVVPGEEYRCADKFQLVVFNLKEPMHLNLPVDKAIQFAHDRGGWVLAINVTKRQAQHLNKMKDTIHAPDAIEIYNDISGGYTDIDVEYHRFASSASSTPVMLEKSKTYTLIQRKEMESMGLLPEAEGVSYIPQYLTNQAHHEEQKNVPEQTNFNQAPEGAKGL
jgi:hypothetical protein